MQGLVLALPYKHEAFFCMGCPRCLHSAPYSSHGCIVDPTPATCERVPGKRLAALMLLPAQCLTWECYYTDMCHILAAAA